MEESNKLLDLYCTHFLLRAGTSPSLVGFRLIKEAANLYIDGMEKMDDIHITLSQRHQKSKSAVERNIRVIINGINTRGYTQINELLGYEIIMPNIPISAKHFIALLCETFKVDNLLNKVLLNKTII